MRAPKRTSEMARRLRASLSVPEAMLWRELQRIAASEVLGDPFAIAYGLQELAKARIAAGAGRPLSQLR